MITIGVTDCSKYANYSNWILSAGKDIEVLKLAAGNASDPLNKCHGILFTGGEDVHPALYNKIEYLPYCYKDDMSQQRDEYEWKLMEHCVENRIPVLGICRGLQFINVFFGGTLIPDIPSWGKYNHSKQLDGSDRNHELSIDPNSWTAGITGLLSGTVNSNHHQSADRIGTGLVASAFSPDGIIEALERKNPEAESFLSLVQWHPERMEDQQNPLVQNIRSAFISAARLIE